MKVTHYEEQNEIMTMKKMRVYLDKVKLLAPHRIEGIILNHGLPLLLAEFEHSIGI